MPEYLTKDVFEVWAKNFDRRLDETIALRDTVEQHASDIAVLADRSERMERSSRHSKGISGLISAIVSGLVGGLVHWGGK